MGLLTNLIEQRSSLKSPSQWLTDWFGGGSVSKAGSTVTEDSALQVMAVFAAVRLLSETEASLPFLMYKKIPEGKEEANNKPLYNVLRYVSNVEQTAMEFRQMMMINVLLCGEAFAEIVRDPITLEIKELWPIPNRFVSVYYYTKTNRLAFYRVSLPDGGYKDLYPESIWHWKWIGKETISTFRPIQIAREAMGLALAAEEFGERFFSNGTNIGGICEYETGMSDPSFERYKKQIKEGYEGLGKANRLIFLEKGVKFIPINTPPDQAQFIETRKFQIEEIARFYNVPPHMIMELSRSTNNNIENQSLGFVIYSIRPWLERIEQSAYKDLLLPGEQKKYFFNHDVNELLRGDFKTRMDGYSIGVNNGWLSPNDVRQQEGLDTYEGGDIRMVNGNMIPVTLLEEYLATKMKLMLQKGGDNGGSTGKGDPSNTV